MHSTLCIAQVYNGRKCTFFSSADLQEWWCHHPTKCPALHFPTLEPILMSNTGKKSEKETLRKQHQCRRFRTDTGKLLQIQSLQATACMLVSTYSCVASNSHGVHVKNVHKCSHKNWDRNVHQKNVHTARILLLTFAACRCRWPKLERSQLVNKVPVA